MEEERGMIPYLEETYDVVIVGAGHAGCEAALASARLGMETIMFTVSVDSIALMPCNPNIGGSSKGHLVRELDALGGEMGKNIDKTFIQSKMLNESKGPAVHSLRAQADKQDYSRHMRRTLENTDHLTIRQAEVSEILAEDGKIRGVKTFSGAVYYAKAVILCTGTYLKARCIYGDVSNPTGPNGLQAANHLTDSLRKHGIEMFRFKTGTPARVDKKSIDFSKMEEQFGDPRVVPFSFSTNPDEIQKDQVSCWLTYTNENTHRIIKDNLDRSPLFSGAIEGTGPRYCPSIEDYSRHMRRTLENTDHLTIRQAEVSEILAEDGKIRGVKTFSGAVYYAKAVILCTGTYLKARCIYGDVSNPTGPNGLQAANHLTDSLRKHGIEMFRFKTGTPARVDKKSIDFSKMEEQFGDPRVVPFSFSTNPDEIQKDQVSCWLTYTNENTHRIIKDNLDRSPLFSGAIEGTGPRYCPSIEDKVVKFPDKNRHQVFVEPEGLYTNEMYLGGMSSSLPEDVQYAMYRTVPGLEKVKIVRNAYAIEYDCINALQLKPTLEFKKISGLFAGGQFNGSSGYEEAAVQGFMAGVNAVMKIRGQEAVVLDRSQAYIGVLIDDLVTKENHEPYRMMTSRAEYRLLLRQDNADIRLRKIGHEIGLVSDEEYEHLLKKMDDIQSEIKRLEKTVIGVSDRVQMFLEKYGSTLLKSGITLAELVKRPELDYVKLAKLDEGRPELPDDVTEQVNIEIKYEGYIKRQMQQVAQFKKLEDKKLPEDFDYSEVNSLRREAVQKLNKVQPATIGQASRISGVSPADISVLLVHFTRKQ